ncbi:MAG TPA: hypothetical protein VEB22_12350 [Phycisphaerales bacterium]|nr:hypothetical protein [Phycisphaerales bacterium]
MKLAISRLFDFAQVAATKAGEELKPFIDYANGKFEELHRALNGGLTFAENFRAQEITAKLKHATEATLAVKSTPKGLIPLSVSDSDAITSLVWSVNQKGQVVVTPRFLLAESTERTVMLLALFP